MRCLSMYDFRDSATVTYESENGSGKDQMQF